MSVESIGKAGTVEVCGNSSDSCIDAAEVAVLVVVVVVSLRCSMITSLVMALVGVVILASLDSFLL